jgi:hypothetical protein
MVFPWLVVLLVGLVMGWSHQVRSPTLSSPGEICCIWITNIMQLFQPGKANAHAPKSGILILLSGALISSGIMIAYWIDYGFYFLSGSVRWRFPIAFQSFFTIIVIIGLLYLPDSPRWLAMRGRHAEARDVTAKLLGKKEDDPEVEQELKVVRGALEVQSKGAGFKFREFAYE